MSVWNLSKYTDKEKFLEIGKLSTEFLCVSEKLQDTSKHRNLWEIPKYPKYSSTIRLCKCLQQKYSKYLERERVYQVFDIHYDLQLQSYETDIYLFH